MQSDIPATTIPQPRQAWLGTAAALAALALVSGVVRPASSAISQPPWVEVVISHAELQLPNGWSRTPIALPISFGRPVAPEDDAAPPAHWRHKRHLARFRKNVLF